MTYDETYTKRLICLRCGGVEWTEVRCWLMKNDTTHDSVPVHEYRCNNCGELARVKSNPFQAPVSRQVFLEKGDEIL